MLIGAEIMDTEGVVRGSTLGSVTTDWVSP